MKKVSILPFFLYTFIQIGLACDCVTNTRGFCSFVQTLTQKQIVARVLIEKRDNASGQVRILNLYKGHETRKLIKVWSGNGANCIGFLGNVGEEFIMVFDLIEEKSSFRPEQEIGDYHPASACSPGTLKVENGKIIGAINSAKREEILDSDPTQLFFCPSFLSDAQELEKIRVIPNPFSTQLVVEDVASDVVVSVFDIAGRLVAEINFAKTDNRLVLGHLASGLYIIRFRKNLATRSFKFVKI
jgi:hypothetical protein